MQQCIELAWYTSLGLSMFFTNTNNFLTEAETSDLKEDSLYLSEEKENGLKSTCRYQYVY